MLPLKRTSESDRLLRQLSDSLRDIPSNLPFRVEMWNREHIRWVITAAAVSHRACRAAVAVAAPRRAAAAPDIAKH